MKNDTLLTLKALEIKKELINLILKEETPDIALIQEVNNMSCEEMLLTLLNSVNMSEAIELTFHKIKEPVSYLERLEYRS